MIIIILSKTKCPYHKDKSTLNFNKESGKKRYNNSKIMSPTYQTMDEAAR